MGVERDYGRCFDGDLLGFRGPDGPLNTDDLLYLQPMFKYISGHGRPADNSVGSLQLQFEHRAA